MLISRAIHLFETLLLIESFLVEGTFNIQTFLSRLQSVITLAQRGATEGERDASREAVKRMMNRAKQEAAQMDKNHANHFLRQVEQLADTMNRSQDKSTSSKSTEKPRSSPPPNKSPVAEFKEGDWVTNKYTLKKLPNFTGKVIARVFNPKGWFVYNLYIPDRPTDGLFFVAGFDIRRATQEEIDAAQSSRNRNHSSAKSSSNANNDWVIKKFAHFEEGTSNKVYGIATKANKIVTFWGRHLGPYTAKDYSESGIDAAMAQFRSKLAKGYQEEVELPPVERKRILDSLRSARLKDNLNSRVGEL